MSGLSPEGAVRDNAVLAHMLLSYARKKGPSRFYPLPIDEHELRPGWREPGVYAARLTKDRGYIVEWAETLTKRGLQRRKLIFSGMTWHTKDHGSLYTVWRLDWLSPPIPT